MEMLTNMVRIQCTAEECARILGISSDTIDRRLKEATGAGFAEFYKKHSDEGKMSLRRAQYQTAMGGNPTMQIAPADLPPSGLLTAAYRTSRARPRVFRWSGAPEQG